MTATGQAADSIRQRLAALADHSGAAGFPEFLAEYYLFTASDDLRERSPDNLCGAAYSHWQLAQRRVPGTPTVRVFNPSPDADGWQSRHTVVQIVTDDMPFLVDSVSMELSRHDRGIHLVVQPVMRVRRTITGDLVAIAPGAASGPDVGKESILHVEFDRIGDSAGQQALRGELLRVLGDVRAAVEDWQKMQARMRGIVDELAMSPPPPAEDDVDESRELLAWIAADHFTFLGYRDYDLVREGDADVLKPILGSGLGLLRDVGYQPQSTSFAKLPASIRAKVRESTLLVLTKANTRSTVHRPSYLDYIGVKRFDAGGAVVGERRFLGLYTSVVYATSPRDIPLLRRKVQAVVDRAALPAGGHLAKALVDVLEGYPRDELFQASASQLFETAMGVVQLQERQRVRVFVRPDTFGRFVSFLVYLPRDRYTTAARLQVQRVLMEAYAGTSIDYYVALSESVLVRIHFVVYIEPGEVPHPDVGEIERRVAAVTRSWSDDLRDALLTSLDESQALELFDVYGGAFPAAYHEDFSPQSALSDMAVLARLNPAGDLASYLYEPEGSAPGALRFKVFRSGAALAVSDVLPLLQNLGVRVLDERPYGIRRPGHDPMWIYDFGLAPREGVVDVRASGGRFEQAFTQVWRGAAEDDGFNRLVLAAGLEWRDVVVVRAYARYQRQTGAKYTQPYVEDALANNPRIAALLVDLFRLRFAAPEATAPDPATAAETVRGELQRQLDAVAALDEDRILRSLLALVEATLRTNFFQPDRDGRVQPYVSLKLDSARVPDLPLPRPLVEVFVYSPRVEAVHLRGGKVARGGIRWSDRREDFRTEVLGLMKAQMVKNAVIVPVGAKGGFVVKRPTTTELMTEVVECYRTMMRGLLDLTDNIVDGRVVPPVGVVRYDDDDTYLVVAADKGTATFSDIANGVAAEYGFWLGDAFASGGSSGYDHKKMGITARGAWESVRRHLRELGVDSRAEDFTVVGVGDMSGDVFGNAMLLSRHIRLVAAFDHRDIFIDPAPDAAASFIERQRLFATPRSSWADYDRALISPGGGVFPRSAKSIPLSDEARAALGVDEATLPPEELIRAILCAPVDLLFNGGIGTYVKASTQTHADVGDRGTDVLRVDATALRCRAVVEGGNLGLTQLARVEYALRGGRIFTDAIDNSAGVDCSDHEVNIKVLLGAAVSAGKLSIGDRDELLMQMTDEVAELVLRDNYSQTRVLSLAFVQAADMVGVYARFVRSLESAGRLNREVEYLPTDAALEERRKAGLGLTAPELAVLLAYTKVGLYDELLASDVPEDPFLSQELPAYFPSPLRAPYAAEMVSHPLRREIVATAITNGVVNRAGITFVFRMSEETGVSAPELVRAHRAAREIFAMRDVWAQIERLYDSIPIDVQNTMQLETRRLIERAVRWLVRHGSHLDVVRTVAEFAPGIAMVAAHLPAALDGPDRDAVDVERARFEAAGAPRELAAIVASLGPLFSGLDICAVAAREGADVRAVTSVYFALADQLGLSWLRARISELPRADRWQTLARAALRDDLNALHAALTADVLSGRGSSAEPAEALDAWRTARAAGIDRLARAFGDIRTAGVADLATLSVAVREVHAVLG